MMVLVDTSIWVSHFRSGNPHLKELLLDERVACHPFIIGEVACGRLNRRGEILSLLRALPQSQPVDDDEVLHFIESKQLMGKGIGLVDVHLLASSLLTRALLWTTDKRLREALSELGVLYK